MTSITDNRAWITAILPTSFTVSPNSSTEVTVTVDSTGNSPGVYSGTISIYSNDPDEDPKTVTVIMNISKYEDGEPCSSDSDCQSNYCDSDGVGLSDDGWCFTPYNTYFDGEETDYCEYSTDNGISDCDEREGGDDLNKCVGTSYYEEECSSTCGYQDITSSFECDESGCSCSQSLCDGLTTGDNITTCASGQTHFADKCTSTASGEDRGDNICRSSDFVSGCSADSQCNGIIAGTGDCNSSCDYTVEPNVIYTFRNSSNDAVASFDDQGNLILKGNCTSSATCSAPAGSINYRNSTGDTVAYIDDDGNLCIGAGDCSGNHASCNPTNPAITFRDNQGSNVAYIGFKDGELCLTGSLEQYGYP